MSNQINKQHYDHYSNNAQIGANLITNIFQIIFKDKDPVEILGDTYYKIPPDELKKFHALTLNDIPIEYFESIDPKYNAKYLEIGPFYKMTQVIVDQFSKSISHDCLVILMDSNGYVPVNTELYSQKITGDKTYDDIFSRHKRFYPDIICAIKNNNNISFETTITAAKEKVHIFASAIKYNNKTWGYFVIINDTNDMSHYQRQSYMQFISIIIFLGIGLGIIAQKVLGLK